MKTSNLKTLLILILLAANILLEAQIIPRRVAEKREYDGIRQSLCSLCEADGVQLDRKTLPVDEELCGMDAHRSLEKEMAAAEALLGGVTAANMGGGIYSYTGTKGEGVFRSGGEFSFTVSNTGYELKDTGKLLDAMGFVYSEKSMKTVKDGDLTLVTAQQLADGAPVYGCTVTVAFGVDGLASVSGRWITESVPRSDEGMDLATAVTTFLRLRKNGGIVCSRIESIDACRGVSREAGSTSLDPGWLIVTDTGEYWLDGITGEMS